MRWTVSSTSNGMENTQNNMDGKIMGVVSIVAGVIVLAALVWWIKQPQVSQQVQVSPTPDAETSSINQDINSINVGDLNAEFDAIDKDLLEL